VVNNLKSLTRPPGKLVDAIFHPNSKFDAFISNVEAEIKKMNALKDAGQVAQTADMRELVLETGHCQYY
jgi:hypothetical protein